MGILTVQKASSFGWRPFVLAQNKLSRHTNSPMNIELPQLAEATERRAGGAAKRSARQDSRRRWTAWPMQRLGAYNAAIRRRARSAEWKTRSSRNPGKLEHRAMDSLADGSGCDGSCGRGESRPERRIWTATGTSGRSCVTSRKRHQETQKHKIGEKVNCNLLSVNLSTANVPK